ncbi:MAG: transglutaminase [Burkholderiaceae bacterium]|nr:MAG: transglutaminase [Burkholderiaceae bacterium]
MSGWLDPFVPRLSAGQRSFCIALLALFGMVLGWADYRLDKMLTIAQQRYGEAALPLLRDWDRMIQDAAPLPETEKLRRVNEFFNRHIVFTDDMVLWHQADYWATPLETMGRAAGDCEDYTIAKYMTLKQMQVPIEKLRLIYVRARIGGPYSTVQQAHMVLGYYAQPNAEPLILDNLISDIRPASRRSDLFPVFSFNGDGLWVGGETNPVASATARLSRWRDVLTRMQQEGIE